MSSLHPRVLPLMVVVCAACAACSAREPFSISSQGFASFSSLELALDDGAGLAWIDPGDPSTGSFGVYSVNDDPLDRTVPGTAGAKLSTYPTGPKYESPGPHVDGPFWVSGYYGLAAGVGPEYAGNWVGLRLGSESASVRGVRFGYSASFDPGELRVELWCLGGATGGLPLERLMPSSFIQREMTFGECSALELRMYVGPPVPEPSSLCGLLGAGVSLACIRTLRRKPCRTGWGCDSARG